MTRLFIATLFLLMSMATPALARDADGREVFIRECAGCHGPDGRGSAWAPSIVDEGAAGVDFMMRTGRMPLRDPSDPIRRGEPRLDTNQIAQITAYVATLGGPQVPKPNPERGSARVGARLYWLNCAACHGSTGVGAALVDSRNAPSLLRASTLEAAEAVRAGPGPMPAFGTEAIDDRELDSLLAYLGVLDHQGLNRGGWSLGRWGPVAEGAAAWLIGIVVVIGAATWIEGTGRSEEPE